MPYPPRTGRTGLSDARAEQSFPRALVVLHAPMRWRCLNRHPLISTRRAPCAARCARSEWGKRDRERAARSISTSCTWRAKYGLPDWTLGLYDCYNRFTWIRELSLLQRQLRAQLPTNHYYRRWGSRVLCRIDLSHKSSFMYQSLIISSCSLSLVFKYSFEFIV